MTQERMTPEPISEGEAIAAMPHQEDRYEIQRLRHALDRAEERVRELEGESGRYRQVVAMLRSFLRSGERLSSDDEARIDRALSPERTEPCSTCGGRGWHTAGGNEPSACGRCPAGERWAERTEGEARCEECGGPADDPGPVPECCHRPGVDCCGEPIPTPCRSPFHDPTPTEGEREPGGNEQ